MSFLLGTFLQSFRESALKLLMSFRAIIYRVFVFLVTSTFIVWLSVFLYGSFYYTYMPAVSHVKPVYLQFRPCVYNDKMCSYPSANITLIKKGHEKLLMRGQQYKVYLDIDMPESPVNQNLGMFMVKIDVYARTGVVVRTSARSAMLHYKSYVLRILNTLCYSAFLLLGSLEEKQLVSVELFDYYEEDPTRPAVGAYLEIQNKAIEFYSASLRIYAHFTGLRYIMFHWPVFAAIIGIGTNLVFLSMIALLSWYRYGLLGPQTAEVVVRVGFEDSTRRIEQRRIQARESLIRERKRQTSLRESNSGTATPAERERSPVTTRDELAQALCTLGVSQETDPATKCENLSAYDLPSSSSKASETELPTSETAGLGGSRPAEATPDSLQLRRRIL